MKFLSDDTAVSPVIGFALVLAIIVSTMGYMQTHFVPVWNAEAESENFENVYQDMVLFSSNLESAAVSGIPRTSPIRLGFNYPTRGIFYNPKTALFGILEVKRDVNVTINYTTTLSPTPLSKTYNSSSLKYELPGNHPYLVYEHGIVIRDFSRFGGGNATGSPNTLIVGDNINIPLLIISGSGFSTVSVQPTIASIYPIELTEKKNFVEYLEYVNITMDTHYPKVWEHVLRSANTSKTNVTVIGNKVYINTTAGNEINLPDETKQVTQAGRFYGGMALVKTTATLETYKGVGVETMGLGSVWKDIPSPNEVTQIILTNITLDKNSLSTDDNAIAFKVIDTNGNFWNVYVGLDYQSTPLKVIITKIETTTKNVDKGCFKKFATSDVYDFTGANATVLVDNVRNAQIDLLNKSNYDTTGGCTLDGIYQNSSIGQPNSLLSSYSGYTGTFDPAKTWIVFYKLIIQ